MGRIGGGCVTFIRNGVQFKICKWEGTIECVILEKWCDEEKLIW